MGHVCGQCGRPLAQGHVFCPFCGAPVAPPGGNATPWESNLAHIPHETVASAGPSPGGPPDLSPFGTPQSPAGAKPPWAELPPPRSRRWVAVVVAVIVVVVVVVVAAVALSISTPPARATVTITGDGFEWNTPPSTFCQAFGLSYPPVPFTVSAGTTFNLSWYETCTSGGPSDIESVSMVTSGFSIVGSNVPVLVSGSSYSWFNVTVSSPSSGYTGQLWVFITAN